MEWYEALILGIIQGLTEFLPISSSGHLELASFILQTQQRENLTFSITVHIATAISILFVFRKDIKDIILGLFKLDGEKAEFISKIIISSIPVGVVGILYEKEVESFFNGNIVLVGSMLLITSLLLCFTYFKKKDYQKNVSYSDALIIGLSQALAILPGISRSGATISTALLLNVNKEKATKFSFLMVLVPIFGILILKIISGFSQSGSLSASSLLSFQYIIGFLSALISGIFACSLMLKIVRESKLIYFSIYCFIVGSLGILYGKNSNNEIFYITPIKEISELKKIALKSRPPSIDSIKSHLRLTDLSLFDNEFKLDIRYASSNNFMRSKFYESERAFLNSEAAENLINATKELKKFGYGIVVFDAYRPWYITKMFWEGTPDNLKHFVADPEKGSSHNRGCAIDIGLYDLESKENIEMISGYDEFTERAYVNYSGGTTNQRYLRDLLIEVMEKNNFSVYENEWWHFNYNNCKSGIMNLSFSDIDSLRAF